jgi:hypothetical protein
MEVNKSSIGLESVIKFFSLIYVLLITCGFTYSFFFFRNFGINITEYIEFSEALSLFIPLLADGFVLISLFLILWYFMNKTLLFGSPKNETHAHEKEQLRKAMIAFSIISLILILILLIISLFGIKTSRGLYMLIAISVAMFLPIILEMIFSFTKMELNLSLAPIFRDILYVMIIIVSIVLWTSFSKTERVYRKSGYKKFEIFFNNGDPEIESDSSIYYLGRTKNYLFIYDFNTQKSRILNTNNIKEFTISK